MKMGKHIPLRMCIACRNMKQKSDLIRIIYREGQICVDEKMKVQQRGAYICKCAECMKILKKKRGLERTFRCEINDETYNMLTEYI